MKLKFTEWLGVTLFVIAVIYLPAFFEVLAPLMPTWVAPISLFLLTGGLVAALFAILKEMK